MAIACDNCYYNLQWSIEQDASHHHRGFMEGEREERGCTYSVQLLYYGVVTETWEDCAVKSMNLSHVLCTVALLWCCH